ncbi:stromal cell-derived factor 2, putative, partial [Ichthyophthirius multifiliis]
ANRYHLRTSEIYLNEQSIGNIVTSVLPDTDINSLFTIKEGLGFQRKSFTTPVKCGDVIRLEHVVTQKNIHSTQNKCHMNHHQEVISFGTNGHGDYFDNFMIQCANNIKEGSPLEGKYQFYLQNYQTKHFLACNQRYMFNSRLLAGQIEVYGMQYKDNDAVWKIVGGYFFEKNEMALEENDENDQNYVKKYGKIFDQEGYEIVSYRKKENI